MSESISRGVSFWSKLFRSLRFQLLWMSLAVCVPPYFAYKAIAEGIFDRLDIFAGTILVFVSSLVMFHVIFKLHRHISTDRTIRAIDYVYLTVAAIGLVGTLDLAKSAWKDEIEQRYSSAVEVLRVQGLTLSASYRCPGDADCAKKLLYFQDRATRTIASLTPPRNGLTEIEAKYLLEAIDALPSGFWEKDMLKGAATKIRDAAFEDYQNSRFPSAPKALGALLVAAALALRLTKTTAELRRWFV